MNSLKNILRNKKRLLICIPLILFFVFPFHGIEPVEVLQKIDNNEIYTTIKYEGLMIIQISGKVIEKSFFAFAEGSDNSFMEFTNADDEGTKYLRKEGNLYVYTEELEEIMPITGHMLKESMMGSDMSYEDMTGSNNTLTGQYNVTSFTEASYEGTDVWILELKAKRKTVSYPKRKLWVNRENFTVLREELFALSGVKLRVNTLDKYQLINGKYFPIEISIDEKKKKNSKTIFKMKNVELDISIPRNTFSLRNLEN